MDTLHKIMHRDNIHKVVPIISNSFYINEVLHKDGEKLIDSATEKMNGGDQDLTIDERLTKLWSESKDVNYPMTDGYNLARVAQYYQVQLEPPAAKGGYLRFRKSKLLEIHPERSKRFPQLSTGTSFSEIVTLLYSESLKKNDPLEIIANIPFLNYVTTSYHDFLERSLLAAKRTPITQYLRLDDTGKVIISKILPYRDKEGELVGSSLVPEGTQTHPIVHHLFGFEDDKESLVLSEDDHIKFLIAAVTGLSAPVTNSGTLNDSQKLGLPMGLRSILSAHNLLMLGYRLRDWDFRVLFRLLLELRASQQKSSIFLQLPRNGDDDDAILTYIREYFKPNQFDVEQKLPMKFIEELSEAYNA